MSINQEKIVWIRGRPVEEKKMYDWTHDPWDDLGIVLKEYNLNTPNFQKNENPKTTSPKNEKPK